MLKKTLDFALCLFIVHHDDALCHCDYLLFLNGAIAIHVVYLKIDVQLCIDRAFHHVAQYDTKYIEIYTFSWRRRVNGRRHFEPPLCLLLRYRVQPLHHHGVLGERGGVSVENVLKFVEVHSCVWVCLSSLEPEVSLHDQQLALRKSSLFLQVLQLPLPPPLPLFDLHPLPLLLPHCAEGAELLHIALHELDQALPVEHLRCALLHHSEYLSRVRCLHQLSLAQLEQRQGYAKEGLRPLLSKGVVEELVPDAQGGLRREVVHPKGHEPVGDDERSGDIHLAKLGMNSGQALQQELVKHALISKKATQGGVEVAAKKVIHYSIQAIKGTLLVHEEEEHASDEVHCLAVPHLFIHFRVGSQHAAE
mmetsp:Transcript_3201/g.6207  ORF Transcript_3201/g.6207 Transcript_3201/m.6207 type:complete len:363 (+) Transcript_3201:380-1468(+)